jgi:hypothetical protein
MTVSGQLVIFTCVALGGAGSVWARDIIYIPAGFPGVCAESVSSGEYYCPPGTERATPFCSENLPYLRQWARSVGLELCGESPPSADDVVTVDQALLVDDRNLTNTLDGLLAPVTRDLRVWEKTGPFRDEDYLVRSVWVVGEGSAAATGSSDTGSPSGEGPGTGSSGDAPVSTNESGGGGQDPGTRAPDGGHTGDDPPVSDTQLASSDDSAESQPDGNEPGSSRCTPGQPVEYYEQRTTLSILFDSDELLFRDRVARALAQYMQRNRADEFANRAEPLATYHAKQLTRRVRSGNTVRPDTFIKRRRCDRRVMDVRFNIVPRVPDNTTGAGTETPEPDEAAACAVGDPFVNCPVIRNFVPGLMSSHIPGNLREQVLTWPSPQSARDNLRAYRDTMLAALDGRINEQTQLVQQAHIPHRYPGVREGYRRALLYWYRFSEAERDVIRAVIHDHTPYGTPPVRARTRFAIAMDGNFCSLFARVQVNSLRNNAFCVRLTDSRNPGLYQPPVRIMVYSR